MRLKLAKQLEDDVSNSFEEARDTLEHAIGDMEIARLFEANPGRSSPSRRRKPIRPNRDTRDTRCLLDRGYLRGIET